MAKYYKQICDGIECVHKVPEMLEEYLETTEQDINNMKDYLDILEEAEWVLDLYRQGEWEATKAQVNELERYIAFLKK